MTYTERMERLGTEFLGMLYGRSDGDWHKNFSFNAIGDDLGWGPDQGQDPTDDVLVLAGGFPKSPQWICPGAPRERDQLP